MSKPLHRSCRLVRYPTVLHDDRYRALWVRFQSDRDFVAQLNKDKYLIEVFSHFLEGPITQQMRDRSEGIRTSCFTLERALMNRARFAIAQYLCVLLHLHTLTTEEKQRAKMEVREELHYVRDLVKPFVGVSEDLLKLFTKLGEVIAEDFSPAEEQTEEELQFMGDGGDEDWTEVIVPANECKPQRTKKATAFDW